MRNKFKRKEIVYFYNTSFPSLCNQMMKIDDVPDKSHNYYSCTFLHEYIRFAVKESEIHRQKVGKSESY